VVGAASKGGVMRFRTETQQERNARWAEEHQRWKRVFAFLPVQVADGDTRWLEFVERRRYENPNFHIGGYLYDYRAITKCAS
jgi:hypothetical protein